MTPEARANRALTDAASVGAILNKPIRPLMEGYVAHTIRAAVEDERRRCAEIARAHEKPHRETFLLGACGTYGCGEAIAAEIEKEPTT